MAERGAKHFGFVRGVLLAMTSSRQVQFELNVIW